MERDLLLRQLARFLVGAWDALEHGRGMRLHVCLFEAAYVMGELSAPTPWFFHAVHAAEDYRLGNLDEAKALLCRLAQELATWDPEFKMEAWRVTR